MRSVLRELSTTRRHADAWAALLRDDSGEGFAEYNAALGVFALQCVVGALIVSHRVDDIVRSIQAIF